MRFGASAPPGPRRGARQLRQGGCLPGHKFDRQKGPKGPFVAKFGVHLGKKSHVARGGVGVSGKKKEAKKVGAKIA